MIADDEVTPAEGGLACPVPLMEHERILLAHGSGGAMTHRLIRELFVPQFRNSMLAPMHDGAAFDVGGARCAFSTDAYVVSPLFFPGGDIGSLAVNGTVNDLAMCGATPLYLSAAMIIEEGFPMDDLRKIVASMQLAAGRADVLLVTGDTKVVGRGNADGMYITTAGIGTIPEGVDILPQRASRGDVIILNGPIAAHGMAVMSVREGLEFGSRLVSDTVPLSGIVGRILAMHHDIHVLRDPTRGGVATSLCEIAQAANVGIAIDEDAIPVDEEVKSACEILGFDPLYVANEGKFLAVVPPAIADSVLREMRRHPLGARAEIIGTVVGEHPGEVVMKTSLGTSRIVDMLSGEQLPRIC